MCVGSLHAFVKVFREKLHLRDLQKFFAVEGFRSILHVYTNDVIMTSYYVCHVDVLHILNDAMFHSLDDIIVTCMYMYI